MDSIAEQAVCAAAAGEMPKFADGSINLQELFRQLAESVINAVMDVEAEEMCSASGNSRNGYRPRTLNTCVGTLNLRIPRFRKGSFFPDDILERYQRTDRALIAAVAEMYETGTSTRKVQRIAERMGIERLSKDQVSSIARSLDADVEELLERPLGDLAMPYVWLDATYVKCRREGHVSSTAIVTAIGCDADGWRHILGLAVVDTESYSSWKEFLERIRERGVEGVQLVTSDAHDGLRQAISEVFLGGCMAEVRRPPHEELHRGCRVEEPQEEGRQDHEAGVQGEGGRPGARPVPPGSGDARGMLPQGCRDLGGCGGRCPRLPGLPRDPLEAAQDKQRTPSAPTARSSAAQGPCRYSRQFALWSAWQGP